MRVLHHFEFDLMEGIQDLFELLLDKDEGVFVKRS